MAEVQIKGWCPTALRPMQSGEGMIVRIRPRMARLTPQQARGLAAASAKYGNGLIDLSARGNIQLRGIRTGTHHALLADLDALHLIDPHESPEFHRAILVTPFWQPEDGTDALVADLENSLAQAPDLPDKFGFAIDSGPQPVLCQTSADIRFERTGDGTLILRPDGSPTGRIVTASTAARTALDLARWFVTSGGVQQGRGRMAAQIAAGASLPAGFDTPAASAAAIPGPGPHPLGFLVGFEFGQMQAETLANLASQPLRITPWRMVLLDGATRAPDVPGLITAADDPRLRVSACSGAPACPQGLQPTRPLARRLAGRVPPGRTLHISGCAKGCAHPGPADVTLCASAAGFNLIRNGRASDPSEAGFDASSPLFKVM